MSTHSTIAAGPIDLDLLVGDVLDRLRPALRAADYTVGAVTDLLGGAAHAALLRDATVPGLRATGAEQVAGTALATLARLWPLQAAVASRQPTARCPGWSTRWWPLECWCAAQARCARRWTCDRTATTGTTGGWSAT